jgi:hypothetical protein
MLIIHEFQHIQGIHSFEEGIEIRIESVSYTRENY